MLNDIYYTAGFSEPEQRSSHADCDWLTAIHIINVTSAVDINALLQYKFSARGNQSFVLGLQHTDSIDDQPLNQLMLLLFHPYYKHESQGRPVYVFSVSEKGKSSANHLANCFRGHHMNAAIRQIPMLQIPDAVVLIHDETDQPEVFCSLDCFQSAYCSYFISQYNPNDVFLFPSLPITQLNELISICHRIEEDILSTGRVAYRLASDNRKLSRSHARLSDNYTQKKEEALILSHLLELSSKSDEVNYILRFYRNEYEILPLWYKRVGHLIKVIMGKRNLRSLFDNTVQKYKD